MANICTYQLVVWGAEAEVGRFVGEVRDRRRADGMVTFAGWGWPVGDGPGAVSLDTEVGDGGRVSGTARWCPPLEFVAQLTRHRPLLVECHATTEHEHHERWVAWKGECRHLLSFETDLRAGEAVVGSRVVVG